MLEDVLHFGKRGLFVEKLFALERGKEAVQFIFGLGDHLADQTHRELTPNDRELLQQGFLVWSESVDTGGEYALHGRRNMQVLWQGLVQSQAEAVPRHRRGPRPLVQTVPARSLP